MKKIICLALLAGLFLFANSCHDDEINQDENLTLKSAQIKEKEAVSDVKSWFENNTELNAFELLKWKDEIKWQKAKVMEINDSLIVEIPIKLKGKYKVMDNNDLKINVEHRLLFIKEKGNITSYMEYFISKKDLDYLMDSEKVNYSKKGKYFEGQIVLENTKKEFKVIHNLEVSYDCEELKLKSAEPISCIGMYELFSDGSRTLLYIIGCTYSSGNGSEGGGTGGGAYISPTPQTCGCNLCPICHKCIELLKSMPIPGEGGTTTAPILCGVCEGHPTPKTNRILNTNLLNATQTNLLETALTNLINQSCLTNTVYNYLVGRSFKINFQMKSDMYPGIAQYDPTNKTMYFKNDANITSENIKEEIFHAAQDSYYSGGIAQYSSFSNVEFEAKLYKDVISGGCCSMFPNDIAPESVRFDYERLVINIKEQGHTSFTSVSYNYWVNMFRQYNPNTPYDKPSSSNFSNTNYLNSFISGCIP